MHSSKCFNDLEMNITSSCSQNQNALNFSLLKLLTETKIHKALIPIFFNISGLGKTLTY